MLARARAPALRRRRQRSCSAIPTIIATTKTSTAGDRVARFTTAGPGHNPAKPQPTPNSTAPEASGASIVVLVGHSHLPAKNDLPCRAAILKPIHVTVTAAAITTARLGSQ